jgi:hypothetical protein
MVVFHPQAFLSKVPEGSLFCPEEWESGEVMYAFGEPPHALDPVSFDPIFHPGLS